MNKQTKQTHEKEETDKTEVNGVIGNEDCQFRAVSFEMCCIQFYHEQIRASIVDFMREICRLFMAYAGRDHEQHDA